MFKLNGLSNIVDEDGKDLTVFYNVGTLSQLELELIEEDTINSIEELKSNDWEIHKMHTKINEIIRKVNQLEKQLKENMQ